MRTDYKWLCEVGSCDGVFYASVEGYENNCDAHRGVSMCAECSHKYQERQLQQAWRNERNYYCAMNQFEWERDEARRQLAVEKRRRDELRREANTARGQYAIMKGQRDELARRVEAARGELVYLTRHDESKAEVCAAMVAALASPIPNCQPTTNGGEVSSSEHTFAGKCANCGHDGFWFDRTTAPPCDYMHNVCENCGWSVPCGHEQCQFKELPAAEPPPCRGCEDINQAWAVVASRRKDGMSWLSSIKDFCVLMTARHDEGGR